MQPEDYQIADEAVVRGWIDDSALAATLATRATWRGFFGELAEADEELARPSTPPAKPAAGAYWQLTYTNPPAKRLAGNVGARRAALDVYIRIQPGLIAADGARDTVLTIARDIKSRLLALATPDAQVDAEPPLSALAPRNGWPEFRQLIELHLEET